MTKFTCNWRGATNDAPEYNDTMADLELHVGNENLTRNEDIWSKTIQKSVLVSAYPLALWLASSWWRLNWEPLPAKGIYPSVDWRMAHELGAADHGFVWPHIIFASDSEVMQIWAMPMQDMENQSIRYLNGLPTPAIIPLSDFQLGVEDFINIVLNRLDALGYRDTGLRNLWQLVQEDRLDAESAKYRRIEAEMGYDPEECPESLMKKALGLEKKMGTDALFELAPVYGKSELQGQEPLSAIEEFAEAQGLIGTPTAELSGTSTDRGAPWQRAVADAALLRQRLGNSRGKISDDQLCDLLGIRESEYAKWSPVKRDAAVAVAESGKRYRFIPRKKHPTARRFELARFMGDYLLTGSENGQWLTSTDISTSRQKYQKAFAAEFLCPVEGLREYLQDDFSEIEEAADHFQVSEMTVNSLLINNGLISPAMMPDYADVRSPYSSVGYPMRC